MIKNINAQLNVIRNSAKWIAETESMQGKKGEMLYNKLVGYRRELKKKKFAIQDNSAAAVYGESQVGKSYLISSLLSESNEPFCVMGNENVSHNFIEEINPKGGGMESTSLVTRFSVNYEPKNQKFPVKAVLLSPADIILILSDSYYNDVKVDHDSILDLPSLNAFTENLTATYSSGNTVIQNAINEDNIWDVFDYYKAHFATKANLVLSSDYFKVVARLINNIAPEKWSEVFAPLWNSNTTFRDLFAAVVEQMKALNFAETISLPIESVLSKHGTILDVQRLKELFSNTSEQTNLEAEYRPTTEVLCNEQTLVVKKPYLCLMVAEIVFSIKESILKTKPFLKELDLLDFPGARARMSHPAALLEQKNIPDLFIRGKVAYLFNKYSEAEKISIFILCAKHEQAAQRSLPEMLNNWVKRYIGETPESREEFIKNAVVSPLFIVGTFFNENLAYNPTQDRPGNIDSLNHRWKQRFESTLATELLDVKTYSWFRQWTFSQPNFQNIYLLRDFIYSESKSLVFRGYLENGKELEEIHPTAYSEFRKDLRQSFLNFEFVKNHFENPENSWDRSAGINEDGTGLIIEKLGVAAANTTKARQNKWSRDLEAINKGILGLLNEHYNSSDKSQNILAAKAMAGSIQAKLDIAFSKSQHFFGPLLKDLMISNGEVYEIYIDKIRDIEHKNNVDVTNYSSIRLRVSRLDSNASFDENLEYLRQHYEKESAEACRQFFEEQGVDLNELFYGGLDRVKNFSQVLAEALEEYWFNVGLPSRLKSLVHFINEIEAENMADTLRKLYGKLRMSKYISDKIWHHVNGYKNLEVVYEMISDISCEILNKFMSTFGMAYFSGEDIEDLKNANEKHTLDLVLDFAQGGRNLGSYDKNALNINRLEELNQLLQENPAEVKALPHVKNYIDWCNALKISFVYVCDIPNYDIKANERLKVVLDECTSIEN
jgi:hypothetical protein